MRTFIALKLPDPIRERLAGYQKQIQVGSTVRWVAPENIHLTLRF
ncbi:RNA 2',3'-cyclic phosphodiesterase, partial [candidate division WOR-3 bacterium]|nr:RNA 2',3'-cyclic phosphodiesterase [candidate division WOR-3 bacterium]